MRLYGKISSFCAGLTITFLISGCHNPNESTHDIKNPSGQLLIQSCSSCHGTSGETIPAISHLSRQELIDSLTRYQQTQNGDTVMHRLMRGYSQAEIESIAHILANPNE